MSGHKKTKQNLKPNQAVLHVKIVHSSFRFLLSGIALKCLGAHEILTFLCCSYNVFDFSFIYF